MRANSVEPRQEHDSLEAAQLLVGRQAEEIRALRDEIRRHAEQLEAARIELLNNERSSVLGKVTAVVSHELRNPLGVIRSSIFYLQRKLSSEDEKIAKHLDRIEQQVVVCNTVIDDLLEFTRGRKPYAVLGDVNAWLTRFIEAITLPEPVRVTRNLASDLPPVPFDPEKMRRVITDLLDNALQAIQARSEATGPLSADYAPELTFSTRVVDDGVAITVGDNGIGMDAATLRQAFDPLFTTRARGTGLGLAIVRKIVDEHAGHVELASVDGEGTSATFVLPLAAPPSVGQRREEGER
jgi:signal transduction histidine kinase